MALRIYVQRQQHGRLAVQDLDHDCAIDSPLVITMARGVIDLPDGRQELGECYSWIDAPGYKAVLVDVTWA